MVFYVMFFIKRFGFFGLVFAWQYASARFGWPLAALASLQSTRAGVAAFVNAIVLPALTSFAYRKSSLRPDRIDRLVIFISACLLSSGFASIWMYPSPAFFALGEF
jgi:hypothetical protein